MRSENICKIRLSILVPATDDLEPPYSPCAANAIEKAMHEHRVLQCEREIETPANSSVATTPFSALRKHDCGLELALQQDVFSSRRSS
jgi:hypothetical protein